MDQGRAEQVQGVRGRQYRRAGAEIFLVEDHLLHELGAAAAVFVGPGDADPAGRMHLFLPGDALFEDLAVGGDPLVGGVVDLDVVREIGFEPAAKLGAKGRMFRTVGKIHDALSDPLSVPGAALRRARLCVNPV